MTSKRYLTAREATALLGVSTATLYAYVSRGLIRSEATGADNRSRRYHAEDVERLRERKATRKNPGDVARQAMHWGAPILESALTLISDGHLYYRGYDVQTLATSYRIEDVAAILWLDDLDAADRLFTAQMMNSAAANLERLRPIDHMQHLTFSQALQVGLALASENDLAAFQLDPAQVAQTGVRILSLMTALLIGIDSDLHRIAQALHLAWCPALPGAERLLDAALILCADHELNVSSFTARVVASAGAQPYAVVSGGLAALQGHRHGGVTQQVEALFREISRPEQARRVVAERLRRGEMIPGFGHPLYPDGDPRAALLRRMMDEILPDSPALSLGQALIDAVREAVVITPNIDFALVVMAHALSLPDNAPFALFALGRTVGWIAHAIEQYRSGDLIRPRAAYIGQPPR